MNQDEIKDLCKSHLNTLSAECNGDIRYIGGVIRGMLVVFIMAVAEDREQLNLFDEFSNQTRKGILDCLESRK